MKVEYIILSLSDEAPTLNTALSPELTFPRQPVPKKGDRSNPSSFRLIALHSCVSKASKSILSRKIHKHLSTSDLISDRQYGFRKGRLLVILLS